MLVESDFHFEVKDLPDTPEVEKLLTDWIEKMKLTLP